MIVKLISNSLSSIMHELAETLSARYQKNDKSTIVQLLGPLGEGKVEACQLHDGLSLFSINGVLQEGLEIKVRQEGYHPLRLIYCQTGQLTHSVDERLIQYQLHNFQNSLSACSGDVNQNFHFHTGEVSIFIVEIERFFYLERIRSGIDSVHPQLARLFEDTSAQYPFLYQGYYSTAATEVLRGILSTDYEDLILDTFLESKTLELLSLMWTQYSDDQKPSHKQRVIRERDANALMAARDYVLNHLQSPPSISELAKKAGINEFKLKTGYKQLFNTTVYQHIQSERLNQARALLKEGKWDVSEVADKVGYTNKSHFAARFREKFGILPKQFQKDSAQDT
ncbi:AraC family transcriptional regulator [Catalinimonas sp. 4WD22]|uniref:helix-turn-helix domain-containing protein n=1 Tax=Catalinimonas locisalis TaxID=3133978 RepID=UPI003101504C